jgi:hypothetical protein
MIYSEALLKISSFASSFSYYLFEEGIIWSQMEKNEESMDHSDQYIPGSEEVAIVNTDFLNLRRLIHCFTVYWLGWGERKDSQLLAWKFRDEWS